MNRVFVIPGKGLRVRHPEKKSYVLPEKGEFVTISRDWLRLIKSGDVVVDESAADKVYRKNESESAENGGE